MSYANSTDPADYYTGLVAQLYRPLRSVVASAAPYARFIERSGQPALELGCGDGDPLLDLVSLGLNVEGLDSSAEMLERCRAAAMARSLHVVLHHQKMQAMKLQRRYRSIFLAGPTFNLLIDDDAARRALHCVRDHLEPGGSALIPLFIPALSPPQALGHAREHVNDDGTVMRVTLLSEVQDERARLQTAVLRYELVTSERRVTENRSWTLHWHTQDGFRQLVAEVGLRVAAVLTPEAKPASPSDQAFVFLLTK